jgi:transposase
MSFGHACPVSDLFGAAGRKLLAKLEFPEPWCSDVLAAVALIDDLNRQVAGIERELKRSGADHRYVALLVTVPGIAWTLGYTIAAEIGDIKRFPSPTKLAGYTGLCARVYQSRDNDRRGPLSKQGPKYLRWALLEAATAACRPRSTPSATSAPKSAWVAARRQGRPDRPRPAPQRGHLAHAHPQPALRSGKRPPASGRIDGPL